MFRTALTNLKRVFFESIRVLDSRQLKSCRLLYLSSTHYNLYSLTGMPPSPPQTLPHHSAPSVARKITPVSVALRSRVRKTQKWQDFYCLLSQCGWTRASVWLISFWSVWKVSCQEMRSVRYSKVFYVIFSENSEHLSYYTETVVSSIRKITQSNEKRSIYNRWKLKKLMS